MEFFDLSDEEIYLAAKPMMECLRTGNNSRDYKIFSKYFSKNMFNVVSEKRFHEQAELNIPKYGELEDQIILGCARRESGVTIIFRQRTANKRSELLGLITIDKENGEYKVINAGLF